MTTIALLGHGVCGGTAEGRALVSDADLALSLIDPATGVVMQPAHPLRGQSVARRILVFPGGSGSSSGSYRLLHLSERGNAPAAIINNQANAVVVAGAVLGGVPVVHKVSPDPIHAIRTDDRVSVDAVSGRITVWRDGGQ